MLPHTAALFALFGVALAVPMEKRSSSWSFLGCYTDNVSGRSLAEGIPAPGGATNMTVQNCQAGCQALGFTLAGLEYADECYCGNTVQNGGGPAPDGSTGCDMACAGNSAEICGGPNRLDLYQYGTAVSTTTSITTVESTTHATTTATSTGSSNYWYENIDHQGISAFGPSGYTVYRNVKDYGATGNGVTDDTAAINAAISDGGRCGEGCSSSTTTPAVVYFPAGTYLISSSIIDQYNTILLGNPNSLPTLKASSSFSGFGLIDGDKYYTASLNWGSTNVFYRQVRNFILDMTSIPATSSATGIHWPTAQATSLQNLIFQMSSASGTQHVGVFCESGSAGFLTDLTFNGGLNGIQVGNQQFTMRNLIFNNCVTAINQLWDWGWVYQGITINNCQTGIDMSAGGSSNQAVGSVILVDSTITNTPVGLLTAFTENVANNVANGSLIIDNSIFTNVPIIVKSTSAGTVLAGSSGSMTVAGWGEGNSYTTSGHTRFQGSFTPITRPSALLSGSNYYVRSKPQYASLAVSSFQSVRSAGATGNGVTDDTSALQNVINSATAAGQVVFFDAGTYKVTSTLLIPPGAKLVGEAYSVIMSSGSYFNNINSPQPVVRVGTAGQAGQVEWSDMIVSTQGAQPGAVLIEWNLAASGTPSGMWDVHARIGGFTGSDLQVAQCEKTPSSTSIDSTCIAAYMTLHVTISASNLYLENVWLWTADHDIDDASNTQITVYNGRGLYIESTAGTFWLYNLPPLLFPLRQVGTSVEHHTLYQYQLANTKDVYMGFIQTETPYYQPNPPAPAPFTVVSSLNDPNFSTSCSGQSSNCNDAWGLRIVSSDNILVYGAGLYSFFNNYDGSRLDPFPSDLNGPENCQPNIFDLEGTVESIEVYCLSTVGVQNMISQNGNSLALSNNNVDVFTDTISLFQIPA
ncbi:exo-beta-1-3-glucanase [Penicillium atrosanguineum]|uniref:Exo-beta-1-3-glucanase n=1 Tax=Penicillium atrosanguineum TaxID=1132637 RepID=A0A9W9QDE6_9EURO|nr:exo-beta-1-3-glucanase [Penicillium atrosanguineum]KAJ5330328.1 exo-beta-1-3-glucanase [Penicillium atrosanguineum]